MKAMLLTQPRPIEESPLQSTDIPYPAPGPNELLVRVNACGVCHTDLHTVEGEIRGHLPIVPGHQVVGVVEKLGVAATGFRVGDRVGVPWLHSSCGRCEFCRSERENLCPQATFTGLHTNGGYAQATTTLASFAVRLPDGYSDSEAAPLLCAGIIGYRALRVSGIRPGQRLGLYGFGASAHIAIQIARQWNCSVSVATRSTEHQHHAKELGAAWVGRAEDVPLDAFDAAVMFAPAGPLVALALRALARGGTLALAGIYMTPIPELSYDSLYHERCIRSVANATRADAEALMRMAGQFKIRTEIQTFPLGEANQALRRVKESGIRGAAVLEVAHPE